MPRTLAIDFGSKRVGLAISDDLELTARPLRVIANNEKLMEKLEDICTEYNVKKIVLGLPTSQWHQDAENAIRRFAERLRQNLPLELIFQDEHESSVYARTVLRLKGWDPGRIKDSVDMYAAQKILEDYLNKK